MSVAGWHIPGGDFDNGSDLVVWQGVHGEGGGVI